MAPPLLSLSDARLQLGRQLLLDNVECAVGKGDRIGLVGRNGMGKTTLMRILAGTQELDAGQRVQGPRIKAAMLAQDPVLPDGVTLRGFVQRGMPETADSASSAHRADELLGSFGLDPERGTQGLSGGEQRRAALAATLAAEPDILLLDEPTNHLDLAAILALEQRLLAFPGGLILISHDRAFLENLTTAIWWLDRGRLRVLDQGYAAFDAWSEQILEAEAAELTRLDRKLEVEAQWLHKGVTARRRRNMGRMRRLDSLREQRRAHLRAPGSVKLQIESGARSGQLVLEADGIEVMLGERPLVTQFSTRIMAGDRIGLIGPNGAGKTTLLNTLTGLRQPDKGTVEQGTGLVIAQFDQHRRTLDPERSLWDTLCPNGGDKVRTAQGWKHVVGYLGDFLFRDEQARQPVKALSGGERNRLLLAKLLAEPANLLVMDEPTNDLDLDTLELLEEALDEYQGTILLVSHDRRFLDRLVTSTIAYEGDGRWREYAGGYSDWMLQRPSETSAAAPPPPKRRDPPAVPTRRAMDGKLMRELERLPDRMDKVQQAIAALEQKLADPNLYGREPAAFAAAGSELQQQRDALAAMEERWLELEGIREASLA